MEPLKKFIVLDTETVGLPPQNVIYDIGWQIVDRYGNVYDSQNYLVREIVTNPKLMMGAYFAKKIFSFYIETIERGEIEILTWAECSDRMRESFNSANVLTAYNLPFDMGAVKATKKLLGCKTAIFSKAPDLLDLWYFACKDLFPSRLYWDVAEQHGWRSEAGNYRTTAECAYRFITGQFEFVEQHTALDDAVIETDILKNLLAKKQTIPYNNIVYHPWRLAQPGAN